MEHFSDLLFREVFPADRIAVSLGIGFHFKTGQVRLGGQLEVVMPVNDRRRVIPALGRAKKEASPRRRVKVLPEHTQCNCHNSHPLSTVGSGRNGPGGKLVPLRSSYARPAGKGMGWRPQARHVKGQGGRCVEGPRRTPQRRDLSSGLRGTT